MAMAAVNKVEANGRTLIDLTTDTVTADTLGAGATAHDAAGTVITGTAMFGGGITEPVSAGDTPVMLCYGIETTTRQSETNIGFTIPYAGTYRFKFFAFNISSSSFSSSEQTVELYKNAASVGSVSRPMVTRIQGGSVDVECARGDVVRLVTKGTTGHLLACIDQSNGF